MAGMAMRKLCHTSGVKLPPNAWAVMMAQLLTTKKPCKLLANVHHQQQRHGQDNQEEQYVNNQQ
jgi:hypothetical protein